MDLYAVAATLSPVLLIALAAAMHGDFADSAPVWRIVMGGFVLLPAVLAIALSMGMLARQDEGTWERTVVLYAIVVQLGASVMPIVRSLWTHNEQVARRDDQWKAALRSAVSQVLDDRPEVAGDAPASAERQPPGTRTRP